LTHSYRQLIDVKKIPACAVVNGTVSNPLLQMLKNMAGPSLDPIFKPCPYFGEVKVMNITADLKELSYIYSEGTYKTILRFYDNLDENLLTLVLYAYVKSGLKN